MLFRRVALTLALVHAGASLASAAPPAVELADAFPDLDLLTVNDIQDPGDGSGRLFALEVSGRVIGFRNDPAVSEGTVLLDLSSRIAQRGMNGLAFHPDHANNGFVYVSYLMNDPFRSVVSRFTVFEDDPDRVDLSSELIILEVPEPGFVIHEVHRLVFGPDGYLYLGSGDNLPASAAQDLRSFDGKILRIDVDHPSGGRPYGIPADNPFAGNGQGLREEVYAFGFRNPWEFSFDASGRLWLGDVGQASWEEIDLVGAGENFGWPIFEGSHCFASPACAAADTVFPVWEYPHVDGELGGIAVIGGEIYQGASCPFLRGKYVYADFGNRNVWALSLDDLGNATNQVLVANAPTFFSATGLTPDGEVLITSFDTGQVFELHCPALGVGIEVGLGRKPVVIDPRRGFTVVTLLGSDELDVSTVDVSSLAFGPDAAPAWRRKRSRRDVNRDGWADLVVRFRNARTGLRAGDTEACLTGETAETRFEGCDDVRVKRPKHRKHHPWSHDPNQHHDHDR